MALSFLEDNLDLITSVINERKDEESVPLQAHVHIFSAVSKSIGGLIYRTRCCPQSGD